MEIPGLISLLKLRLSIQELTLISELIPILESLLIPFPEHIVTLSWIETMSATLSARKMIPNTELESCRSDPEPPSLVNIYQRNI